MDLRYIIAEIATHADELLAGASNREQGRAGIAELLTADYPELGPPDRKQVTVAVMAILEDEDFFGTQYAGGAFDNDETDD